MSKITASAENIFTLVNEAREKILEGEESPGIGVCMKNIVDELNSYTYKKKSNFDLRKNQLYKQIYLEARKLVKQNKGHLGLTYIAPYLDRLSLYVHNQSFEKKYGKFNGILWDVKQGIEKVPNLSSNSNNNAYIKDLKELGITGTVNKLSSSRFEPNQCMLSAKYSLYFMGLLGSKWVVNNKKEFTDFLAKTQVKNGKVRFLMINPRGENFKLLKSIRGEYLKDRSSHIFRELVDKYPCLEARFYESLPCFRLIFIDNKILAMSRYGLTKKNYLKSEQGWEVPHLVIEAEQGNWSLFDPFLSYYETIWSQAKDIREIIEENNE